MINSINFISQLYIGFLGREPEPGAIEHWCNEIKQGTTADQIVNNFFQSTEFQIKHNAHKMLFVPLGHFYSPIVDVSLIDNKIFDENNTITHIAGINTKADAQLNIWRRLLPYIKSFPFTEDKISNFRYYTNNSAFSIGDAYIYFSMILLHRPNNIVEIGSGYSSALAIDTNENFFDYQINLTFIEPYPNLLNSLIFEKDFSFIKIFSSGVQQIDIKLFMDLNAGDFLFIDSTHILKTGSDVCTEIFDILPSLKPGVFVHFHDVFWPFEYPRSWVINEKRSWNEIYALRAYLMNNDLFEIVFFNDYFSKLNKIIIYQDFPKYFENSGCSLWLKKVK
jgi:hypothetical protein